MIITAVPVANNLKARYLNPKQQSRLKEGDDRSIQLTFHPGRLLPTKAVPGRNVPPCRNVHIDADNNNNNNDEPC
jgi:hypothetical protein